MTRAGQVVEIAIRAAIVAKQALELTDSRTVRARNVARLQVGETQRALDQLRLAVESLDP